MTLHSLLLACAAYDAMGSSVQGQLRDVLNGQALSEQNINALQMIKSFLADVADELDDGEAFEVAEMIDEYQNGGAEDDDDEEEEEGAA